MNVQGNTQGLGGSGGGQVMLQMDFENEPGIIQRPYTLFNNLVDKINTGKADGEITPVQYQSVDPQQ